MTDDVTKPLFQTNKLSLTAEVVSDGKLRLASLSLEDTQLTLRANEYLEISVLGNQVYGIRKRKSLATAVPPRDAPKSEGLTYSHYQKTAEAEDDV